MHGLTRSDLADQLPISKENEGSYALFELLLEGLAQPDAKLAQACVYALAALGEPVIPQLRMSAAKAVAGSRLSHRLTVAIAIILELIDRGEAFNHSWIATAILDALRPRNRDLTERAMNALQYLPTGALDGVITLAVVNSNDREHCLRLLSASERYNRSLSPSVHLDLLILTSHPDAVIRAKANQLVLKFRTKTQSILGMSV